MREVLEQARAQQEEKDAALEREVAENAAAAGRQQALCAQLQQEADALSENYNKLQDDIKAKETALEKCAGRALFWKNAFCRAVRQECV